MADRLSPCWSTAAPDPRRVHLDNDIVDNDIVAAAAEAMSDDELADAISVLHAHERELLIANDVDRAFRVMRDKFVFLSVQNERCS